MTEKDSPTSELDQLNEVLEDHWLELSYGTREGFQHVEEIEGENRRWTRTNQVIVQGPSGKYYSYLYEEGLTEMQENYFYGDSAVEVEPVEKTVTVKEWKHV